MDKILTPRAGSCQVCGRAGSRPPGCSVHSRAEGEAIALQADVGQPAQVERLFDAAIAHYGCIDVPVNNAGIMINKLLKDTTNEDFTRQFEINVRGTFNTMRQAGTSLPFNSISCSLFWL